MRDRFSETELLSLIEGDLEPKQAADLRRRLAGDRQLLALVERLQDDREMLRAMEQPRVPDDLLAELEPMMARPMLMPDSGDWRQRYRKPRPWRRYFAAAAVLCLALLAGVWAVTSGVLGGRPGATPPTAVSEDAAPAPEIMVAEAAVIEDRGPIGETPERVAVREPPGPQPARARRDRGPAPAMTTAELVLVVSAGADGEQSVQDALTRVVTRLDGNAALVRNFSFQEAEQIARRLEARADRRLDGDVARAREDFAGVSGGGDRVTGGERLVRRRRAAGQLARTLDRSDDTLAVSGQLAGPRALAPSYEQQIEYAERGATWTIAVSADRLNDVLADLQLAERLHTVLQLQADGAPVSATGPDRWLLDYPRILRQAAQLDGTVLVPVIAE